MQGITTLGAYTLFALCLLMALDMIALVKAADVRLRDKLMWVGIGLIFAVLGVTIIGCGPRKIVIYPIKGCDYWSNGFHTNAIYGAGPHNVEWPYGIKRCYPDTSKPGFVVRVKIN